MKKQLIILSLALASCCSFSEIELPPPSQELEPIESGFTYHTPLYYINLRDVLFKKTDSNASDPFASPTLPENDFQFLVLPPFDPEILLTVTKGETNYIATISKPEKQVWSFEGNIEDLRTTEKRKEIAPDLAARCDGLWKQMLIRVQLQRAWVEPDGPSYCFFKYFKGAGTVAGMTHAKPNSKPSMLAGVGLGLIQYVDAPPEKEAAILSALNSRIERLEKALETTSSNQSAHGTR